MFVRWINRSNRKGEYKFCYLSQTKWIEGKPKNQTLAALGRIGLKPTKSEREVFWLEVNASLSRFQFSTEERKKIEAAIAKKVPSSNSGADKFTSSKSDEHYTPPNILQAVYECLGELDLDPCSNSHSSPNVNAKKHFTIEDDGLAQEWSGRVFINPPFSDIKRWVPHVISEYSSGRVTEAIALTKAYPRTNWYKKLRESCQAICFVEGYQKYGKAQTSATFGTLLTYFGSNPERFCEVFKPFGICKVLPAQ